MNIDIELRKKLENLSEKKYKKFASSLIPTCKNLIGVRIPLIRKLSKEIPETKRYQYLNNNDEIYFEEIMLKAMIIGNIKDINLTLKEIEKLIPKIDNWSTCDTFVSGLKIIKTNQQTVWPFLTKYYKSNKTYEIRFAVVTMLSYFINEKYIDDLFRIFNDINKDDYYVKMSVAWAISMCFVKYPDKTLNYLRKNKLDKETYNKTLQKIIESRRVLSSTKEKIKSMKIKNQEVI